MKGRTWKPIALAILTLNILLLSQTPHPQTPSFEVASVKPNNSGSRASSSRSLPGGGFTATNIPLRLLILQAYRIKGFQLTGGPDWLDSARFDIAARAPENARPDELLPMLRALLADRFKLVAHKETKDQPVYALVMARSDGRLGPKLKPSTLDCSIRPELGQQNPCGMNTNTTNTLGSMKGTGKTLADLAGALGNFIVNRMVVDRTGMAGAYDFELSWTTDNLQSATNPAGANISDAPSIFTAVQEQLGLKLESQRGPVEFLVIDSVERPSEN